MKLFIEELRERIRQSSLNGFELVVGPQMWTVGYFLWMIVISGVIHAFGAYDAKPDMALERFIAVLASHIPMMLTIYLSLWVSRRFSPFRKLLTVIAGLYIGGAVRGYVLQTLMIYFDASIFDDYAFRVFGSAMNVAILGMALSYLLSITKKWSELFQSLRSAQLQLEELLSQTENEIEQVTNEEISSIKYELVNRISTLKNFKPEVLSQQIKNLIDNNVRPLITTYLHAVQQFSSQQVTQPQINFRWMSLLKLISAREFIRPVGAIVILVLINFPSFNRYFGFSKAIVVLALIAFMTTTSFGLARRFAAKRFDELVAPKRFVAIAVTIGVFSIPSAVLLSLFTQEVSVLSRLPIELPFIHITQGIFFGFWGAAQKELIWMQQRITDYNEQIRWKIAELNGRLWHHKRKFARLLHGPIQAELAAFAIRIDRNSGNQLKDEFDPIEVSELAGRVGTLMENDAPSVDLVQVMEEISETWLDICAIEYSVTQSASSDLSNDHLCHEVVVETIREVCSNAIRHGGATEVKIVVHRESPQTVCVEISNNGTLRSKDSIKTPGSGIGSLYIDECTIEHAVSSVETGVISRSLVPVRL